jgi:hypothetical protein
MDVPTDKQERKAFLEALTRRAQYGDAEAAFQMGAYNVTRGTEEHYDAADRCFLKAIEFGGSSWAWLAVDEYMYKDVNDRFAQWMTRAIELDFPLPSAPGITVAPDTMEPTGDWSGITCASAAFQIVSENPQAASTALAVAADRLSWVDQNGHEWSTVDEFYDVAGDPDGPLDRNGNALYCPDWASEPYPHRIGPFIMLHTTCQMWGPMARTMLCILIEELVKAGVTEARIISALAAIAELPPVVPG